MNASVPARPAGGLAIVARQAIVDSAMNVVAYELLYRRSETALTAELIDARQATLEVISSAVLEVGLERLSPDLPVHINYPEQLLIADVTPPIAPQRVVIEVLETVRAEPAILAGISAMRARGHKIALDDFSPQLSDLALLAHADIVKLEISQHSHAELARLTASMKAQGLTLIAERVETAEDFERCLSLGFDAFQGYFLQHPKTFSSRPVPSSKLGLLHVVALLQTDDASIQDVERLISQDVGLSYRLLRCINSSFYGFSREVDSIRQAVLIMGFERLRQLCALVTLRELGDRPPTLFVDAMARARMCEQLGPHRGMQDCASLFITGLFSTLDVVTGIPMTELLSGLPLGESVRKALASGEGGLGAILREVITYERGAWNPGVWAGVSAEVMQQIYLDAVSWAGAAQSMIST